MVNINLVLILALAHLERHFPVCSEIIACGAGYHALTHILVFNEGSDDAKFQTSDGNI